MELLPGIIDKELRGMNQLMNRWFGPHNGFDTGLTLADWTPRVDVEEDDKAFVIKAELPEVKKQDVKVHVEDGTLTLSGERRQQKEQKNKKFHRIERSYGSFLRSFTIPTNVDATKIVSTFTEGMLVITMPKMGEVKPSGRDIAIG
jgi:HSP20 family protein